MCTSWGGGEWVVCHALSICHCLLTCTQACVFGVVAWDVVCCDGSIRGRMCVLRDVDDCAAALPAINHYHHRHSAVSNSIMNDPRVVRGSTYAARIISQAQREDEERLHRQARMQAKRSAGRRRGGRKGGRGRAPSPEPVPGRAHMYSQTDEYLEELTDRPPEKEATTQTDALMDRPPSPLFKPAKIGVDKYTQIEPGDLFNFDVEVEPVLEVLVGKTLEQAMDEVLEEEELANIRKHKAAFEQQRNIELAEVQRLEAEERRKAAEKERRVEQEARRVRQEEEVMEKVAARGFAKSYLADLHSAVFDKLVGTGHFFDPVEREVDDVFIPWLHNETVSQPCLLYTSPSPRDRG